jgi:hypothetical protein
VLASWVYLCLPHKNNPSFRRRVRMRAKELLRLLYPIERGAEGWLRQDLLPSRKATMPSLMKA